MFGLIGIGRFVQMKQNRDSCMAIKDNYHTSDGEGEEVGRRHLHYPLILKPCKEVPSEDASIYYDGLYSQLSIIKNSVSFCVASSGKEIGSPVIAKRCTDDIMEEYKQNLQKLTYDSNGRFRNVFNGGHIGVQRNDEGQSCHTVTGNTIITSTIQGLMIVILLIGYLTTITMMKYLWGGCGILLLRFMVLY